MGIESLISRSPIPANWQFSPQLMTNVMSTRHPGVQVGNVRLIDGSDGTSSRARIGLEYSAGEGPTSVFAKTKGDWKHRFLHLATGNAFIEARLFSANVALPLEHPTIYHTVVDRPRLNDLVIMEDLALRNVRLNDGTSALTVDEVASGLRGLARMHSALWGFTHSTHPTLAWVQPWKATRVFQWLMKFGCMRGIPRLEAQLPAKVLASGADPMVSCWARYLQLISHGPMTLLHGDAHVGNTYITAEKELGFLDWGVVRRGHWSFDVGYFIVSALDVADRRAHEKELLEEYRRALQVPAHELPTAVEAWLRYCASPAYGLAIWVTTGAEDSYQSPAVCQSLSRRFGAAFVDLDTPAALTKLESYYV